MRKGFVQLALVFVAGCTVGVIGIWVVGYQPWGVNARVVEGQTTYVDGSGDGIMLDNDQGYSLATAAWSEDGGETWHSGDADLPTCIEPGAAGQNLELGVAHMRATSDGPGAINAVWFQCLG